MPSALPALAVSPVLLCGQHLTQGWKWLWDPGTALPQARSPRGQVFPEMRRAIQGRMQEPSAPLHTTCPKLVVEVTSTRSSTGSGALTPVASCPWCMTLSMLLNLSVPRFPPSSFHSAWGLVVPSGECSPGELRPTQERGRESRPLVCCDVVVADSVTLL